MSTRSSETLFWLTQHKFPWHKCSAEFPPWKEQSVSLSSILTESSETFLVKNTLLGHLVHKLTHIRALPVAYFPHMLPELGWLQLQRFYLVLRDSFTIQYSLLSVFAECYWHFSSFLTMTLCPTLLTPLLWFIFLHCSQLDRNSS